MPPDTDAMDGDDSVLAVYNKRLIALSAQAEETHRLATPHMQARAISPICGSEVEIDLEIKDNKINAFGFEVEACALTKTVVAVMRNAIIGKTREEIRTEGNALEAMLAGEAHCFTSDWQDLEILAPVKDYKARHNSIMLPFEAVEKAFEKGTKIS